MTALNEKMDDKAFTIEKTRSSDDKAEHQAQLEVPEVIWWKSPGLRHLYLMMPILFLGSTVNGYDASLLNGLQTMDQWSSYFNNPSGATLGLFTAIQNIGAISALPFTSYAAGTYYPLSCQHVNAKRRRAD